jgi:dTMP kinase
VEIGLKRAAARRGTAAADRFESEDVHFHQQLRDAYREIAKNEPERCVLIDASEEPAKVAANIWSALRDRFFATSASNAAASA